MTDNNNIENDKKSIFTLRLLEELQLQNITAYNLASRLGISKQALSYYINGRMLPNNKNMINIANILNVTPAYLLGLTNIKNEVVVDGVDGVSFYMLPLYSIYNKTISADIYNNIDLTLITETLAVSSYVIDGLGIKFKELQNSNVVKLNKAININGSIFKAGSLFVFKKYNAKIQITNAFIKYPNGLYLIDYNGARIARRETSGAFTLIDGDNKNNKVIKSDVNVLGFILANIYTPFN